MNTLAFAQHRVLERMNQLSREHRRSGKPDYETQRDEYDGTIRRFKIKPTWEDAICWEMNFHAYHKQRHRRYHRKMVEALTIMINAADEVRDAENAAGWDANP